MKPGRGGQLLFRTIAQSRIWGCPCETTPSSIGEKKTRTASHLNCSPCYCFLLVIYPHGERSFRKTPSAFSTPSFCIVIVFMSCLFTLTVREAFIKLFQHCLHPLSVCISYPHCCPVPSGRFYNNTEKEKNEIHIKEGQ